MKGGHGDNYYWQLVANVRRYKGMPPLPRASKPVSIRMDRGFGQWRDVEPEYRDHVGETIPRDFDGAGGLHYVNRTGRNDLVACKVARDAEMVWFYARTAAPLTPAKDPNWMSLLIDADQDARTGWEGYDFIVNRIVENSRSTWLERNRGDWQWEKMAKLDYRAEGRELVVAIPRKALGLPEGTTAVGLRFKWADNVQHPGDAIDFWQSGDVAPDGRFMFPYVAE
jgi:hypothetical protein